jgi:hypothetical protein
MLDCACSPPGLSGFSLFGKKKKKAPPPNEPPAEIEPKEVAPPPPPVVVAPPPKPSILKIRAADGKINLPSVALYSTVGIGALALLWFLSRKK